VSAAAASQSNGPAKVATLAGREGAEFFRRYRQLKGEARDRIEDGALETPQGRAAFLQWFRERQAELLAVGAGATAAGAVASHFTVGYLTQAFASGWRQGALSLSASGRSVDVPGSLDAASEQLSASTPGATARRDELLDSQRVQLADLSRDVEQEVSRVVAASVREGRSAREAATAINGRVDKVGVTRARTIARTELSRAHSAAAAERYRTRGVRRVNVVNPSPCPEICAPIIADNPYSIAEARNLIPERTHPNCLCFIAPAT